MLNEKLEFEILTTIPEANSHQYIRITTKDKGKADFVGIERALEIIARGLLYDEQLRDICKENDTVSIDKLIKLCSYLLGLWCGLDSAKNTMPDFINKDKEKGLNDYITHHNLRDFLKKYVEKWDEITYKNWDEKNKDKIKKSQKNSSDQSIKKPNEMLPVYNSKMEKAKYNEIDLSFFKQEHTLINMRYTKGTRFYKIIASALDKGPLCEYYMICKNNLLENNDKIVCRNLYCTNPIKPGVTLSSKTSDKGKEQTQEFIKLIAYLCLSKRPQDLSAYIVFNHLYTWSGSSIKKITQVLPHYRFSLKDITSSKEKIERTDSVQIIEKGEDERFYINKDWHDYYQPLIVSKEEFDKWDTLNETDKEKLIPYYKDGFVVYSDPAKQDNPSERCSDTLSKEAK